MSRMLTLKRPPDLPPRNDPFRYGWRYVLRQVDANGNEVWDQIPLTLDDVLHPEVGDFIVNSTAHGHDCKYLVNVIESRCKRRPRWRAVVLSDTRVAWGERIGLRGHGPDIAVIKGVRSNPERDIRTFDVEAEGVTPSLIIEVTSKYTRFNDLVTKVAHSHRAGVPQYVIADAIEGDGGERVLRVIDYRHTPDCYVQMPPDKEGRVELVGLGLLLGIREERVVLYDAKTGEEQGDYTAIVQALEARTAALEAAEEAVAEAVEARHEAERARQAAEARAVELAERLRALEEQFNPPPPAERRHQS
jgi:colicin import membrane protein